MCKTPNYFTCNICVVSEKPPLTLEEIEKWISNVIKKEGWSDKIYY